MHPIYITPVPGAIADAMGGKLLQELATATQRYLAPEDDSEFHSGRFYTPGRKGSADAKILAMTKSPVMNGAPREFINKVMGAPTAVDDVADAIELLRLARDLLRRAKAPRAVERVRLAIKSADGALRHAQGMRSRTGG
jgi:hypothetical protein